MPRRESPSARLRVLIVDQHEVSRGAIRALLRTEGLDVVADVSTAAQVIDAGADASFDVAIVDISGPRAAWLKAARALASLPCAPTVLLTSSAPVDATASGFAYVTKRDVCAHHLRLAMQPETTREPGMSMQTYLENIEAQTGKTPDELIAHARADGRLDPGWKAGGLVSWLKERYGLGHGHAMAIVAVAKRQAAPPPTADEKISRHFNGRKATWRPVYDELVRTVSAFGSDTDVNPGATYLSLRRAGKKFAIVQVTSDRLDIGIKLKGAAAAGRLEAAGSWNRMVTHRVRVQTPAEVDRELVGWLERAYAHA